MCMSSYILINLQNIIIILLYIYMCTSNFFAYFHPVASFFFSLFVQINFDLVYNIRLLVFLLGFLNYLYNFRIFVFLLFHMMKIKKFCTISPLVLKKAKQLLLSGLQDAVNRVLLIFCQDSMMHLVGKFCLME